MMPKAGRRFRKMEEETGEIGDAIKMLSPVEARVVTVMKRAAWPVLKGRACQVILGNEKGRREKGERNGRSGKSASATFERGYASFYSRYCGLDANQYLDFIE